MAYPAGSHERAECLSAAARVRLCVCVRAGEGRFALIRTSMRFSNSSNHTHEWSGVQAAGCSHG